MESWFVRVLDKCFDWCQHDACMVFDERALRTAIWDPLQHERALCHCHYQGQRPLSERSLQPTLGCEAAVKQNRRGLSRLPPGSPGDLVATRR
jgi:hypothetical protein